MRIEADVHPRRDDRIIIASPFTAKDLVRTLPGARWSKDDNKWSVPLAWTSCLAMRAVFEDDLEVGDDLSKWAWARKRDVIDPAMHLRESMGAGLEGDERLYPYQRAGVEFLALVKRALLADEMGTGKTIQAILALRKLKDAGQLDGQILVVCPNTMKRTWERELGIWWGDPEVEVAVISGSAEQRRKKIRSGATFVIINWEGLRSHSRLLAFGSHALKKCVECGGSGTVKQAQCEVHERELNEIDFAAVVADEAHRAKDPHSMQTRALWAASGDTEIRFAMTGTPIANDPTELWPVLHWIDGLEWPAKSAWVERLISFTYNIWGGMEVNGIKPTHDVEFHAGVDPHLRRMTKELVLPFLPPIVPEQRDVEMNPTQKKSYEQMRDLMIAKLDAGVLLAANPMVQVARLMQLASSHGDLRIVKVQMTAKSTHLVPVDPETGKWKYWGAKHSTDPDTGMPMVSAGEKLVDAYTGEPIMRDEEHLFLQNPSSKLDAFMGDIGDFDGQSVLVFAESRQLIEMLSERLHKNPANKGGPIRHGMITGAIDEEARNRAIDDFQRGDFQYVLSTIKAGGTGITLTKASVEVFIQRNWSPVEMDQAIARAHRIGSEEHESITKIDYVTPGTVEMAQLVSLDRKRDMLEEIVHDEALMRKFLTGEPL
jgi:SNF2 family DNA or RNA helicase